MRICKVVGKIVSTLKDEKLVGLSLVLVQDVKSMKDGKTVLGDETFVAADCIGSGDDNYVLVTEGSNARYVCHLNEAPVDMAVVGIIDKAKWMK